MGQAVTSVTSGINGKVIVSTNAGDDEYDDVILATHSDISLKILGESATAEEKKILGAIPYQSSSVYLHTGSDPNNVKSTRTHTLYATPRQQLNLYTSLAQVCLRRRPCG